MTVQIFPHEREAIAKAIKDAIDAWCLKTYDDGHRSHLGASLIGRECDREIWYGWRWVKSKLFDGRMQRLFNRGHREEERFIEWLRGIGFTIHDITEDGNQHRISAVEKHFGGSLDSIGVAPPEFGKLAQLNGFLVEYKTHNEKSFAKLVAEGVRKVKPEHWVQMCTYGRKYGFKYALYCAINKNDDELQFEIVELNWSVGETYEKRAETIILSQNPPPRLSELPTHFKCKLCSYNDVCHKGAAYELNCRSCKFAYPVKNGEWFCGQYNSVIPKEFIPKGCTSWKPVGRNG